MREEPLAIEQFDTLLRARSGQAKIRTKPAVS